MNGPLFLLKANGQMKDTEEFPLTSPEKDCEVRKEVKVLKTDVFPQGLGTKRFQKFSSLKRIVKAITRLKQVAQTFRRFSAILFYLPLHNF